MGRKGSGGIIMDYCSVASLIDNTLLKRTASFNEILAFVKKSLPYNFRTLVIPPFALEESLRYSCSENISCRFSAVVGFPLGYISTALKCHEIETYKSFGPALSDIDAVININYIKSGDWHAIDKEMQELCKAAEGKTLKLIIETPLLTHGEITHVCKIALNHENIHFIKTGTGFSGKDTSIEEVRTAAKALHGQKGIKVSGGVRSLEHIQAFLDAGAAIFGSSAGITLVEEARNK
jgi:deoxyribose-phosphate aldolase